MSVGCTSTKVVQYRPRTESMKSTSLRAQKSDAIAATPTGATTTTVYRLPRRKIKRVPVTSCDTCRLRKLKCNAKELPKGVICGQCSKHQTECTFEDRDEVLQIPAARGARSKAQSRKARPQIPFATPKKSLSTFRTSVNTIPSGLVAAYPDAADMAAQIDVESHVGFKEVSPPASNAGSRSHIDLFAYPQTSNRGFSNRRSGRHFITHHDQWTFTLKWDEWDMPSMLTDPITGTLYHVAPEQVAGMLINRFFAENSFNIIVVPDQVDIMSRLSSHSPSRLPDFLLQTILACAASSSLSHEPEIQQWKSHVWTLATESVYAQLSCPSGIEFDLIQALLLLSGNWPGELARIERVNTFDAAVGLATSIQLHVSSLSDTKLGNGSQRVALFWVLYCFDKILSSVTGRRPNIPRESHDVPLPTAELLNGLCIRRRGSEVAWLQRLTIAFITLCQMIEDIHDSLYCAASPGWATTLNDLTARMQPLEAKLEQFCREYRWFLDNLESLPISYRTMAEAVISLMHLTQLQLYLVPLKFEVDRSVAIPITFSLGNQKPVTATIESAWHLVQQAPEAIPPAVQPMSFSLACAMFGAAFYRFLAGCWAQWDNGNGCVAYGPWNTSDGQLSQEHPFLEKPDANNGSSAQDEQTLSGQHHPVHDTSEWQWRNTESVCRPQPGTQMIKPNRPANLDPLVISEGAPKADCDNSSSGHCDEGSTLSDLVLPDHTESSAIDAEHHCAASPSAFFICTPARLFFQDDANYQEKVRSNMECLSSNRREQNFNTSPKDTTRSHAMLTPMDSSMIDTFCKFGDEVFINLLPEADSSNSTFSPTVAECNYVHVAVNDTYTDIISSNTPRGTAPQLDRLLLDPQACFEDFANYKHRSDLSHSYFGLPHYSVGSSLLQSSVVNTR